MTKEQINTLKQVETAIEQVLPLIRSLMEQPAKAPAKEADSAYTLEDVRAVLAEKSRAGHTEAIKALLNKYGAERLSAVDPASYEALMADAEVIGNE